jgi:hypothetical protein
MTVAPGADFGPLDLAFPTCPLRSSTFSTGHIPMSKLRSHLEIAIASISAFSEDGKLDLAELETLLALALRDEIVDEDEKRVLVNVLTRAERDGVAADVQARIAEVRAKYPIPA